MQTFNVVGPLLVSSMRDAYYRLLAVRWEKKVFGLSFVFIYLQRLVRRLMTTKSVSSSFDIINLRKDTSVQETRLASIANGTNEYRVA